MGSGGNINATRNLFFKFKILILFLVKVTIFGNNYAGISLLFSSKYNTLINNTVIKQFRLWNYFFHLQIII